MTALSLAAMTAPLATVSAQNHLPPLFSDRMVMQRGVAVPVWGWAAPGDEIVVTFDGKRYAVHASSSGRWSVSLPAHAAGGPHEMIVADGGDTKHFRDIRFGDVWVCSGQSNMELVVVDAKNGPQEVAEAHDDNIRHFKVQRGFAARPDSMAEGGPWEVADREHVGHFTAVGYFFARELRRHVDVPIGLLHTSWGGARIEPWMSAAALHLDSAGVDSILRQEDAYQQRVRETLRARLGELPTVDAGMPASGMPGSDDGSWRTIAVPALWPQAGLDGFDGAIWYRTSFTLTDAEARAGVKLGLGKIDASDVSYVNGHEIGRMDGAWNVARVYDVPPSALVDGPNAITVRVQNYSGGGGIYGDSTLLFVRTADGTSRPLAGTWRIKPGLFAANPMSHKNQIATLLYNKMVHPLLPYPIKGVLWYQGESNGGSPTDARHYRVLFSDMIENWRRDWAGGHLGNFPFLWVQLPNYLAADSAPQPSDWALLRESQNAALALPNTGQALAIDLGDANDLHPKNKQDVGRRLALTARHVAYGQSIVASGPVFRRQRVQSGRIVLEFDDVGGGLVTRGPLHGVKGFAIAGADQHFVWADAEIQGDRVVVWSDHVSDPVAVRYAWGTNPAAANLYNRDGLPASPFRTDLW